MSRLVLKMVAGLSPSGWLPPQPVHCNQRLSVIPGFEQILPPSNPAQPIRQARCYTPDGGTTVIAVVIVIRTEYRGSTPGWGRSPHSLSNSNVLTHPRKAIAVFHEPLATTSYGEINDQLHSLFEESAL